MLWCMCCLGYYGGQGRHILSVYFCFDQALVGVQNVALVAGGGGRGVVSCGDSDYG
jgi:hypothetical protein